MINRRTIIGAAGAILLLAPAAMAQAQGKAGADQPIYGSQMMTRQERLKYNQQMRQAKTAEERERIRQQHHTEMQARARERGIILPDEPPSQGKGRGMGGGTGGGGMGGGGMGGGRK